jgi:prevent-host-death family protein
MKTMIISDFKAKCIATVKRVKREREPVLLTIRGKPYAVIQPVAGPLSQRILGSQRDAMRIHGDIVATEFGEEWELVVDPAGGLPTSGESG